MQTAPPPGVRKVSDLPSVGSRWSVPRWVMRLVPPALAGRFLLRSDRLGTTQVIDCDAGVPLTMSAKSEQVSPVDIRLKTKAALTLIASDIAIR